MRIRFIIYIFLGIEFLMTYKNIIFSTIKTEKNKDYTDKIHNISVIVFSTGYLAMVYFTMMELYLYWFK